MQLAIWGEVRDGSIASNWGASCPARTNARICRRSARKADGTWLCLSGTPRQQHKRGDSFSSYVSSIDRVTTKHNQLCPAPSQEADECKYVKEGSYSSLNFRLFPKETHFFAVLNFCAITIEYSHFRYHTSPSSVIIYSIVLLVSSLPCWTACAGPPVLNVSFVLRS